MATVLKLDGDGMRTEATLSTLSTTQRELCASTTPMPSKLSPLSSPSKSDFLSTEHDSLTFTDFQLTPTESFRSLSYSPACSPLRCDPTPLADGLEKISLSLTECDPQITPTPLGAKSSFVFTDHVFEHCNAFEISTELDEEAILSYKIELDGNDCDDRSSEESEDENPFLLGLAINIPMMSSSMQNGLNGCDDVCEVESCDEDFSYSAHYSVDAAEHDWLCESVPLCMADHDADSVHSDSVDRPFQMKKYQYLGNIGIGAFGIVDKVLHLKHNRFMAIKQSRSIGEEVLRQFRTETRLLREFGDCAYIIDLLDFGRNVDANQICLGLEYMDVGSLCNLPALSMAQLQFICVRVLFALQTLHASLVVHNDLKPANILVSSDGRVKLIDFGCALRMDSADAYVTTSIGSIRYLSFEKRFVLPIRYTTKSDLYSLGVTLSELFNGEHCERKSARTPYDHYFVMASPTLKASRPRHTEFDDFIGRCMEQKPEERWSATQLLAHPFLESAPTEMRF